MLRRVCVSVLLAAAAACATPRPAPADPHASADAAMQRAMQMEVIPEPQPLPTLNPPFRLQSELEALSHSDIARWIFPAAGAERIVRTEVLRGHMPRPGGIALYAQPHPTSFPGVCEVERRDVWLRVPDENRLTYQQHLNPPLQPYQYTIGHRWRVIGSTMAELRNGRPDCPASLPYGDWFEAPGRAFVHRAVNLVERAQARPAGVRLVCRLMRYEEARQDFGHPPCPNGAALIERLTPNLIKRIRPADCEVAPAPRGCIGIEYHDPAAPGTHSFYLVTVPDDDRLSYVQITQGMLPPS